MTLRTDGGNRLDPEVDCPANSMFGSKTISMSRYSNLPWWRPSGGKDEKVEPCLVRIGIELGFKACDIADSRYSDLVSNHHPN